jgi:hypothetical protein
MTIRAAINLVTRLTGRKPPSLVYRMFLSETDQGQKKAALMRAADRGAVSFQRSAIGQELRAES